MHAYIYIYTRNIYIYIYLYTYIYIYSAIAFERDTRVLYLCFGVVLKGVWL